MITIIPIEPLNDEHALLIIAAFSRLLIDKGGQSNSNGYGNLDQTFSGDGYGYGGYSFGDGDGDGHNTDNGKCPEEWRIDESSMKPTGG